MGSDVTLNKEIARKYLEEGFAEAGKGNRAALDAFFAPNHKLHTSRHHDDQATHRDATEGYAQAVLGAVPNLRIQVERLVGEGDMVAAHWKAAGIHQGSHKLAHVGDVAATGKPLNVSGVSLFRFENGKIAEMWVYDNILSSLMQIGAIATPATAGAE